MWFELDPVVIIDCKSCRAEVLLLGRRAYPLSVWTAWLASKAPSFRPQCFEALSPVGSPQAIACADLFIRGSAGYRLSHEFGGSIEVAPRFFDAYRILAGGWKHHLDNRPWRMSAAAEARMHAHKATLLRTILETQADYIRHEARLSLVAASDGFDVVDDLGHDARLQHACEKLSALRVEYVRICITLEKQRLLNSQLRRQLRLGAARWEPPMGGASESINAVVDG